MRSWLAFSCLVVVCHMPATKSFASSCERVSTADDINEAELKSPPKGRKKQTRKDMTELAIDGIRPPKTANKSSLGVDPITWTKSAGADVKNTMARWGDWIQTMRSLTSFFTIQGRGDSDPRMFNTIHADGKRMLLLAMDGNIVGAREIYARHAIPLETAIWEKRKAAAQLSRLNTGSPEFKTASEDLAGANRGIGRHIHAYSIYQKYINQLKPEVMEEITADVRNHLRTERPDLASHMIEGFNREQAWDHYRMHVEGQPNAAPLARQWAILKGEIWDTFAGGARQGIDLVGARGIVEWVSRRVPVRTPLLGEVSIAIQDYAAYHNHLSDILSVFTPGKKLTPRQAYDSLSRIYTNHGRSGLITFFRIRFTHDLHGPLLEHAKTKHSTESYATKLKEAHATAQELPDLGVTTIPLSIRKSIGFATAMVITTVTWQQLEVSQRLEDTYEFAKDELHELLYPQHHQIDENDGLQLTQGERKTPRYPTLGEVRTVMQALQYAALETSYEAALGDAQALTDMRMIQEFTNQLQAL